MRIALSARVVRFFQFVLIVLLQGGLMLVTWFLVPLLAPEYSPLTVVLAVQLGINVMLAIWYIANVQQTPLGPREYELMAAQEQLQSLYDNSPVPYVTIDARGKIIEYNLAAVRFLQTETNALIGLQFTDYISHEDTTELSVLLGKLESGVAITDADVTVQTVTGEERYALLSVFTDTVTKKRLISLVDVTEQKRIDRAKSEFVALATHQLRTPVAAIRWNVELLKKSVIKPMTEQTENYFVKVERNVTRMISLINDFLSVSKLETGTFSTSPTDIMLIDFFRSVIDEFAQTINEKELRVEQAYTPETAAMTIDTRLLHIIVSNLFSNAVKYTPAGGVIQFGYQASGGQVVITVADSGIGIPQDEQERLFSKFFRARNARNHQTEGTGLGLYIVAQSVEKLGGTISVTSAEDKGTAFTIALPHITP